MTKFPRFSEQAHEDESALREKLLTAERAAERAPGPLTGGRVTHAHLELGFTLQQTGDLPAALDHFVAAHDLAAKLHSDQPQNPILTDLLVESLGHRGSALCETDQHAEAADYYRQAIELLAEYENTPELIDRWQEKLGGCHGALAIAYDDSGDHDEAFGHYRISLALAEQVAAANRSEPNSQGALALAHNAIGHHYGETDQLHDAIVHHQASLSINQSLATLHSGDPYWTFCLATDAENLSDALLRSGDAEKACEQAEFALELRQQLCNKNPTEEGLNQLADSYRDVGDLSQDRGDLPKAVENYRAALNLLEGLAAGEDTEADFRVADARLVLGYTYEALGDRESALGRYLAALDCDEKLMRKDPDETRWSANAAHCHLSAGVVLLHLHRTDEAQEHIELGDKLLRELCENNPADAALLADRSRFCTDIAGALTTTGQRELARTYFEVSVAADRALLDFDPRDLNALSNLAINYDNMAVYFEDQGDLERALEMTRTAVAAERDLVAVDPESIEYQGRVALALINQASIERQLTQLDFASRSLDASTKISRRLSRLVPKDENVCNVAAQLHRARGLLYRAQGQGDEAATAFEDSVALLQSVIEKTSRPHLWLRPYAESLEAAAEHYLDSGRGQQAILPLMTSLQHRMRLFEMTPADERTNRDLAHTHEMLAEVYSGIADISAAHAHRESAARIIERIGKDI